MSKKFIDLANLKSNLENFLSEIITPTFATKEAVTGQLGNHTVKSDVPENAVFTDTVYDDTEVKEEIAGINSNLNYYEKNGYVSNNLYNKKSYPAVNGYWTTINNRYNHAGVMSTTPIPLKAGTYTFDFNNFSLDGNRYINEVTASTITEHYIGDATKSATFTFANDVYVYFQANIGNDVNTDSNRKLLENNAQIVVGSKEMTYTPFAPSNVETNESLGVIGKCKNLLNPTLQTTTQNGVTLTNNGDGTYMLNGTASAECNFLIPFTSNGKFKIIGCPKGGNIQSYYMDVDNFSISLGKDFGEGCCIDYVGNIRLNMCIAKDATVDLVFKPMITTNTNATYDDFVPYTGDGDTLTHDVAEVKNDLDNYALKSLYGDTTINVGRLANSTVGNYSTAEGAETTASGDFSHAEGSYTKAKRDSSHAEGCSAIADGDYSHAEGNETTASGDYSHAEGSHTTASGESSHAEGNSTKASNSSSHAEGSNTTASGDSSHAEGSFTTAGGISSHAEGDTTTASGDSSHAESSFTIASGDSSHAEGNGTDASGDFSHAEGDSTTASGDSSHAEGYYTKAANYASHASGKYNAAMATGGSSTNTTGTAFVIGNGTGSSALSNAFSVQYSGIVKAKSTITASTTADYAEFFEWLDKNPNEEDRVGHFVTLDGDKIKIATSEDDYILGIVSGEPFVLGNGDCDTWNGMYLHDEFRRTMYEPAPKMIEILDNEGNPTGEYKEVEGEYEGTRPILNPDYDPTQEYVSRFDRVEWSPVGMLGVLAVLHDGTAEVNGYVTVNDEGIATKCTRDTRNSYRVIKKVSDKVVEVIFK